MGGAESGLVEYVIVAIGFGALFHQFPDFLEYSPHLLNHLLVQGRVPALEKLATLPVQGYPLLSLHLEVLEQLLLPLVTERRVIQLLA